MSTETDPLFSSPTSDLQSRPHYGVLAAVTHASYNIMCADGPGLYAVIRVLQQAGKEFAGRTLVVACVDEDHQLLLERLRNFAVDALEVVDTEEEVVELAEREFSRATMGMRLYLAGSESFLATLVRCALEHDINHRSIVTELCGSLARRVQCVHCKTLTEGVKTNYYCCPRCGETLLVRDHYSRRLGAYQGVCATVEAPGWEPEIEEAYR